MYRVRDDQPDGTINARAGIPAAVELVAVIHKDPEGVLALPIEIRSQIKLETGVASRMGDVQENGD